MIKARFTKKDLDLLPEPTRSMLRDMMESMVEAIFTPNPFFIVPLPEKKKKKRPHKPKGRSYKITKGWKAR